jgi:gluconokinase
MGTIPAGQAQAPLVLTLDVGSSSLRVTLYDRNGDSLEGMEARTKYQLDTTPDGGVEKDPDELFQIVVEAIDRVMQIAGERTQQIEGVAIDTFWHSLLGVDKNHQPLTPVLTWADTRSAGAAEQLKRELDQKALHARTGCVLHPTYFPAKLRWLATTQPVIHRRVTRWLSFGEYFYLKLFGECTVSLSMASGTGLLDQNKRDWDGEILEFLKLAPDQLSPLSDVDQPQRGKLKEDYARRWPRLAEVPWFPAIGDGAAGNLGSGCFSPDRIAVMVGTSGAMRVIYPADKVEIPWGLWCYHADRRRFVLGGALSEGGNLFAWMRQTFQLPEVQEVERELSTMEPDGHGLTVLPFLSGERSPGWNAHARATISGLTLSSQPVEILRAGLESIAYRFGFLHQIMETCLPEARQIIASGGALLNSPTWMQILADVLNRPVVASGEGETTSRGTALLALEQLGAFNAVHSENRSDSKAEGLELAPFDFGETFYPDPARHNRYLAAMERQQALYQKLLLLDE